MAKVLGVGGVFFKARDIAALKEWYGRVLGLAVEDWGGVVFKPDAMAARANAATILAPFEAGSDYFEPSGKDFMINLCVDDLDAVLARCKEHGVEPVKLMLDDPNGRFAHIMDPEGTKIELWAPKA